MASSLTSEAPADPSFTCDCYELVRPACAGEAFYKEHEDKRYCVLHYPSEEKSAAFNEALRRKLDAGDFDFRGVWFPDKVIFTGFTFSVGADFSHATFSAGAYFNDAIFSAGAYFNDATFNARVFFSDTTFSTRADFSGADFGDIAYFKSATFNAEVDFSHANFNAEAYFSEATFKDYVLFAGGQAGPGFGDQASLHLRFTRIERPERVSFHTLTLRPHWFVNVDARKFDLTNVEWRGNTKQELQGLNEMAMSAPRPPLAITYRQLAVNAEENHRYEEASRFRYSAMDMRRQERWLGLAPWSLSWWYWAASGYGERILRAFLVLLGVWLLFAGLYTQISFARPPTTLTDESSATAAKRMECDELRELPRALTYSFGVMTLQKPDPRPETVEAQTLATLETILGPLQAALLALAIRRRFMR